MDLTVEMWSVERLVPYARNPRKNDEQVEKMAASIREFGFRIPVVAKSDGSVIDGHLRLKAALVLGLSEVPVALADDLTDAQVKAFRILSKLLDPEEEGEPVTPTRKLKRALMIERFRDLVESMYDDREERLVHAGVGDLLQPGAQAC